MHRRFIITSAKMEFIAKWHKITTKSNRNEKIFELYFASKILISEVGEIYSEISSFCNKCVNQSGNSIILISFMRMMKIAFNRKNFEFYFAKKKKIAMKNVIYGLLII